MKIIRWNQVVHVNDYQNLHTVVSKRDQPLIKSTQLLFTTDASQQLDFQNDNSKNLLSLMYPISKEKGDNFFFENCRFCFICFRHKIWGLIITRGMDKFAVYVRKVCEGGHRRILHISQHSSSHAFSSIIATKTDCQYHLITLRNQLTEWKFLL